jgi:hypothetical protein
MAQKLYELIWKRTMGFLNGWCRAWKTTTAKIQYQPPMEKTLSAQGEGVEISMDS